jgi:hypothetical protein
MKKMIFRKPFVSESKKELAKLQLELADHWLDLSNKTDDTDLKNDCLKHMHSHLSNAARNLGFRSIKDMNEWIKIHDKF